MSALANGLNDGHSTRRRSRWPRRCRSGLHARVVTQSRDSIEQRTAVSQGRDAEFFQVLGRQVRQDLFGYLILAECSLILPEAQLSNQTTTSMTVPELSFEAHHPPGERTLSRTPSLGKESGRASALVRSRVRSVTPARNP